MTLIVAGCVPGAKQELRDIIDDPYTLAAYTEIVDMLEGRDSLNFKRAVFLYENAFYNDSLDYNSYTAKIDSIVDKLNWFIEDKKIEDFGTSGHYAVYSYMCEPGKINDSCIYEYDFKDFMGYEDWSNMFVTKLLETHKGNCHSLPMMFKLLTEEMGAEAFLAMGPAHMYIKHRDESGRMVNIELTNGGGFSSDAWIISSMGITTEAIKSGIYMEPLTLEESVAVCLYDLCMGYKEKKGFTPVVDLICDKVLEHYPRCVMAMLLKADYVATKGKKMLEIKEPSPKQTEELNHLQAEYNELMMTTQTLGHRDMTEEEYDTWARSVEEEMKK